MSHRNRRPGLFGNGKVYPGRACHMSLHHPKFPVPFKETPDGFFVGEIIIYLKFGKHIDMSSHGKYFLIVKFGFSSACLRLFSRIASTPCMNQEVKLNPLSVHLSVEIHNAAFRAAEPDPAQHMQHMYRFFHFLSTSSCEECQSSLLMTAHLSSVTQDRSHTGLSKANRPPCAPPAFRQRRQSLPPAHRRKNQSFHRRDGPPRCAPPPLCTARMLPERAPPRRGSGYRYHVFFYESPPCRPPPCASHTRNQNLWNPS